MTFSNRQLLQTPHVTFAAYNMPHPQEGKLFFRIETTSETNPTQAFKSAIKAIMANVSIFESKFQVSLLLRGNGVFRRRKLMIEMRLDFDSRNIMPVF